MQPNFKRMCLVATTVSITALFVGIILSVLFLALLFAIGIAGEIQPNILNELFARIVLVALLAGLAIFALRTPHIRRRSQYGLRVNIMYLVFGTGVSAALLDPFYPIWSEYNLIRYPTALVLTVAGVLLIRTALIQPRHVLYRLFGGGLGAVLLTAAADEIMQFHESVNITKNNQVDVVTGISDQDLPTLVLAMTGILVVFVAHNVAHYLKKNRCFHTGGREVAAANFILIAGIIFFFAMLFDTFDIVLTESIFALLTSVLSDGHLILDRELLSGYVRTLANSLEEFLEYATAVLLLSSAIVFSFETN